MSTHMPGFQSDFLHHFVLAKLVSSSILRVKTLVMPDFQDDCTVRPGLPGHVTTMATSRRINGNSPKLNNT